MKTCMQAWPCARAIAIKSMSRRDRQTTFCPSVTRRTATMRSRSRAAASKLIVLGGFGHLALEPREQRLLFAFEEQHDLVDELSYSSSV